MSLSYPVPDLLPGKAHISELFIKRSRFIASLSHGPDIDAARNFIQEQRQRYADATHNCWAFCAGPPADTARIACSDDGEPHGTAGRPMLTILLHSGIGELACVVTRYFGGVKLGTAGLVRAYQDAVRTGLEKLPTKEWVELINITVDLQYKQLDAVRRLLPDYGAELLSEKFTDSVNFCLAIPKVKLEFFEQQLNNLGKGNIKISTR